MSNSNIIGERIRYYRKMNNITQIELAEKLGVASGYISNIEQGNRNPSLEMLVQICDWFGVELTDVYPLGAIKEMTPKEQLIYEIAAICRTLEMDKIGLVKTMVCAMNT